MTDYIGTTPEGTYLLWPGVVHAWEGYLRTGRYGLDTVQDLRVMDEMVQAGIAGADPSALGWGR